MANALITLSDLFFGAQRSLSEDEARQLEQADDTQTAKALLTEGKESADWPATFRQITAELPRLFDIFLLDILLAGWEKYHLVTEYADQDSHPPGERTTLDLELRSLSSTHKPLINLMINDKVSARLIFTIQLHLQFQALRLTLGAGRIWCIETGQCEGAGSILMKNHTILERTFNKVDLPGKIDFPTGLRIPTPSQPYRWGEAGFLLKQAATRHNT